MQTEASLEDRSATLSKLSIAKEMINENTQTELPDFKASNKSIKINSVKSIE